eukprot:493982-Amphidinium_carterae.1
MILGGFGRSGLGSALVYKCEARLLHGYQLLSLGLPTGETAEGYPHPSIERGSRPITEGYKLLCRDSKTLKTQTSPNHPAK